MSSYDVHLIPQTLLLGWRPLGARGHIYLERREKDTEIEKSIRNKKYLLTSNEMAQKATYKEINCH